MSAPNPADLPQRSGYGSGVYRRRIRIEVTADTAIGELEDDFHHFRAILRHDGSKILEGTGVALRMPWTTCAGAMRPLERLQGLSLQSSLLATAKFTDPRMQCTHAFDAATLAVAHAARFSKNPSSPSSRCYSVDIPDRKKGLTRAELRRDGELILIWELDRVTIQSPEPFSGRSLSGGRFASWAEETFDEDGAEAAQVMRRACVISMGRIYQFDAIPHARLFAAASGGACHTFRKEIMPGADRVPDTTRDFTDEGEAFHAKGIELSKA